jgi:hypothetical protein
MAPRVKKPGGVDTQSPRARTKTKFSIGAAAKPTRREPTPVPHAADVIATLSGPPLPPPPPILNEWIGSPRLVVAIDIETHGWEASEQKIRRRGPFGWITSKEDCVMEYARIVEIAWVTGPADQSAPSRRSELVQPFDFTISAQATDECHQITNDEATNKGLPLIEVLRDFMNDVANAVSHGGRVVMHHLEFDAGIITNELQRAGLEELSVSWKTIASQGFCTMHPDVGDWAARSVGADAQGNYQALGTLARMLLPKEHKALRAPRHRACPDAVLTYWAYCTMLEAAKYYRSGK